MTDDLLDRIAALGETETSYLQRTLDDYLFFLDECMHFLGLDRKQPIYETERRMALFAATGPSEGGPRLRGVLAPRGVGKTTIITTPLPLFRLHRDPDTRILVASKAGPEAKKIVFGLRGWIDAVPFLQYLTPDPAQDHRDTTDHFDVAGSSRDKTPSVFAKGVDGSITGTRAHIVLADDVEGPMNTRTIEARERLDQTVSEFDNIASYGDKEVVYCGTIHHEDTLYAKLTKRGYHIRTYPMVLPEPGERVLNLDPEIERQRDAGVLKPGDSCFPGRYGADDIAEKRATGHRNFAMQFKLLVNLASSARYPLRLSDLIVMPVHRDKAPLEVAWGTTNSQGRGTKIEDIPMLGFDGDFLCRPIMYAEEWGEYTGTKMRIDPAGRGFDKVGYAIIAHLNGYLWVKAVGGLEGGFEMHNLERLARLARSHKVTEIRVEDNFGQGMFVPLMEPVLRRHFLDKGDVPDYPDGWRCSIQGVRSTGQKEVRIIEALEGPMASHRIVVDPSAVRNEDFQIQLTRMTTQRGCLDHDDLIDAFAACVQDWRDVMRQDPNVSAERERERRKNEAIAKYWEDIGIRKERRGYYQRC